MIHLVHQSLACIAVRYVIGRVVVSAYFRFNRKVLCEFETAIITLVNVKRFSRCIVILAS